MSRTAASATIALLAASVSVAAQSYSPPADSEHPTTVYWGDTHVHTSYSTGDANLMGLNVVSPTVAYRFARGETVTANNGMRVRIRKPLDFLVIADHAENLGVAASVRAGDPNLLEAPGGRELVELFRAHQADPDAGRLRFAPHTLGDDYIRSVWSTVIADADAYNDPGEFTAFSGYEWTSVGTVAGRVRQPPPRGAVPRRREHDGTDPALQRLPQPAPGRPVGVPRALRGRDRRAGHRHPAQRQHQQRGHVRAYGFARRAAGRGVRRAAQPFRACLRGDPDQGRQRGPPRSFPHRRVRRLRDLE